MKGSTTPPRFGAHDRGNRVWRALQTLSFAVLVGAIIVSDTQAQESTSGIAGKIFSSETGEPLGYANVLYTRTDVAGGATQGIISKGDGSFRINAVPGTYRIEGHYIAYARLEVTEVVVEPGKFTVVDLALTSEAIQVETVKITAKEIRNTDASLLAKQKKAPAVSDGISSEQIQQTSDNSAAEVVNRVTGLSVVGGKYVFVRGLGERYSSTQLNGSTVGSPEPNRRVVPLDIFPSGLLDKVVVQKTYTPDKPGEFGGGLVDITTLDFPANQAWGLKVGTGRNTITTGEVFATYPGGSSTDWLGFSNGSRAMPDLVTELASDRPVRLGSVTNPDAFTAGEIEEMGRSFNKYWSPTTKTGPPKYDFAAAYGNEIQMFGKDLGFVGSVTLDNSFNSYDYVDSTFESRGADGNLNVANGFDARRSTAQTLLGALGSAGYRLSAGNTLRLRGLYTRSSDDDVRVVEGVTADLPIRRTRLRYVERGLLTATGGMEHNLRWLANSTFDWQFEYSEAERNEPDRREYTYELRDRTDEDGNPIQVYELSRRSATQSYTRYYEYTNDYNRGATANYSLPFTQWQGLESSVKVGGAFQNKDRRSTIRRFAFAPPQFGDYDFTASPESLLVDENIGGTAGTFRLEELTRPNDGHVARQDVAAGYAMVDVPLARRLRLITGARVEESEQEVVTGSQVVGADPEVTALTTTDVLPSANLTVQLHSTTNLRLAYSRTLNRPDLRELSTQEYYDFDKDRRYVGNPELTRALLQNYDVRLEFFPGASEVVAVSGFYKDLEDPIEYAAFVATGSNESTYQPYNIEGGTLLGAEIELRTSLARIAAPLGNFGLNTNLALIDSEAKVGDVGEGTSTERPLTGQSPYTFNFGVFFSTNARQWEPSRYRFDAALLFNTFGERLEAVGVQGMPDIYEMPRSTLDMTAAFFFGGGARLKASFGNLTNSEVRYEQDGQINELREVGRSFSLSIGYGSA